VACVADGVPELAHHVDCAQELAADAPGRAPHSLRAGVAAVDDARAALRLNATEELAVEALAYRLARVLS
jgi:DNA polymerase-3 subunit delta'